MGSGWELGSRQRPTYRWGSFSHNVFPRLPFFSIKLCLFHVSITKAATNNIAGLSNFSTGTRQKQLDGIQFPTLPPDSIWRQYSYRSLEICGAIHSGRSLQGSDIHRNDSYQAAQICRKNPSESSRVFSQRNDPLNFQLRVPISPPEIAKSNCHELLLMLEKKFSVEREESGDIIKESGW